MTGQFPRQVTVPHRHWERVESIGGRNILDGVAPCPRPFPASALVKQYEERAAAPSNLWDPSRILALGVNYGTLLPVPNRDHGARASVWFLLTFPTTWN